MNDVKSLVREYYDRFAGVYDVKHGVSGAGQEYNFRRYYEPFLRETIAPGSTVLELGCGTGFYTKWLADHGCRVVAMDISPAMIAEARRRCPAAEFIEGDCEQPAGALPENLRQAGFDYIVGINTFSYYPHKAEAMARFRDLLREGGKIVLIDMNGRCPFYRIMKWTGRNEMRQWYQHVRHSRAELLKQMTRDAGLSLRKLTHFTFVPNALGPGMLPLIKPLDAMLSSLPGVSSLGMRVAMVAERNGNA